MLNRVALGLVVIAIGLVLLGNTTGRLPWYVWGSVLAYWPVLVVGLGLQILLSRWKVPVLALVVIAMLVLAVLDPLGLGEHPVRYYRFTPRGMPRRIITVPDGFQEKQVEVPLTPSLSRLTVRGRFPVCELTVKGGGAEMSEGGGRAAAGRVSWDAPEAGGEPVVEVTSSTEGAGTSGQRAELRVEVTTNLPPKGARYSWDLSVNPSIPVDFFLDSGLVTGEIDGASAALDRIEIDGEVIDLNLSCGLSGRHHTVSVDGGVVNLAITANRDCGVRVSVSGSRLTVRHNFSQAGLVRDGNAWVTPQYSSAGTKLDVVVSAGAGSIVLHRVSW